MVGYPHTSSGLVCLVLIYYCSAVLEAHSDALRPSIEVVRSALTRDSMSERWSYIIVLLLNLVDELEVQGE